MPIVKHPRDDGVFSVAMCGEMKFSTAETATVACGVMLFVNFTATRAFSPATGALLPRVANPDSQLAVGLSPARGGKQSARTTIIS